MEENPKRDNGIFDEVPDFLSKIIEIPSKNSAHFFLKVSLRYYNEISNWQ